MKKVNKNGYHEKCNHYYQNEKCLIMARVNAKTIRTVRHICLTSVIIRLCQSGYKLPQLRPG